MAALSPFYYQRLFARLVKKPVMEYVRLRRFARAAEELSEKGGRILDIALDLGFQSHEHFTRTFKEAFGMTPEAYRRNPIPLNRMTKPQLLMNYVFLDEGVPLITDGIVLEINRCTLETPEYFVGLEKRCRSGLSRASVWNRESIRLTLCGVHFMIRKTVLMFLHVRVMSLV